MSDDKNIAYVGTLQDTGRPYSMLFVDKDKRQLYIVVRLSDAKSNCFLVANVTSGEVQAFMNESMGLINILGQKSYRLATISNGKITLDSKNYSSFEPTERMKKMNMFDPELCDDDVWLEIFLNRVNNNQPLEIA